MLHLIHGPDEFLVHEAVAAARGRHDIDSFNVTTLRGSDKETTVDAVRQCCDTIPFLGDYRLVYVDGLLARKKSRKGDEEAEDDASAARAKAFESGLADYLPRLPESTILIIAATQELGATSTLLPAARKLPAARAAVVHCVPPKSNELQAWLVRRAEAFGSVLQPAAARLLADSVAPIDLRLLDSELAKLRAYVDEGQPISAADVEIMGSGRAVAIVWHFTDAVTQRSPDAYRLLHALMRQGDAPEMIIASLARPISWLLQARDCLDRGIRDADRVALVMGLDKPWRAEKFLSGARRFTVAELSGVLSRLSEMDVAMKRSKADPMLALDLLVYDLTKDRGRAPD